jgi:hydroxymethylbilane synthase
MRMERKIRIGTRGSKLALVQAGLIKNAIFEKHKVDCELVKIKTTGDKIIDSPLAKIGGKGLFVKEIEESLKRGEIDIAVHSMKDVPIELKEGLKIAAITEREDPRDVLISRNGEKLSELNSPKIGTSSLRRQVQLKRILKNATIENLRGNLDTRIRKLKEGKYDVIVVAAAGLKRLGFINSATEFLSPEIIIPAIGQGSLGIEAREEDREVIDLVKFLDHNKSNIEITAERAFLKKLEGGCQVPIAAFAELKDRTLKITGMVSDLEGKRVLKASRTGAPENAKAIGTELAEELLNAGAREILQEIYGRELTS